MDVNTASLFSSVYMQYLDRSRILDLLNKILTNFTFIDNIV
jgi:hypothetical protein